MSKSEESAARDIRLARQIEAYWEARGFEVICHRVDEHAGADSRALVPGLRSDMNNGLPKPGARQIPVKGVRHERA
ncbi:hypothetical protein [Roseibium alexandrii]|uniref:Uncharacterized protein n=1 Tax=Roseibium alexandrii (strain DSM 17067 / NCIMB 14079 / DFL-11) TaxID=244592 RepID=A0A5E8GYG8_ROSAD|nr:hypothetical protein [Roseibium alexandrii]EEE44780.1 hypothetical protein SADFL11_2068 [Roseibium alexandrii DFL-11]